MFPRNRRPTTAAAVLCTLAGSFMSGSSPLDAQPRFRDVPARHRTAPQGQNPQRKGIIRGYPQNHTYRGQKPLSRDEASALVQRLIQYLEQNPGVLDGQGPSLKKLAAATRNNRNELTGLRDDFDFHVRKQREKEERPGRVDFFGLAEFSITHTGDEANRARALRFPYDWQHTPNSGTVDSHNSGRWLIGTNLFKLGLSVPLSDQVRLQGVLASDPGGQAGNTGNGFELPSPSFQGEALFVEVLDPLFDWAVDARVGYFWLPWGREVEGLLRTNPLFNSNSLFYQNGFSQALNTTGLFFSTHMDGHLNYKVGVLGGEKAGIWPPLGPPRRPQMIGIPFAQQPRGPDNDGLGWYASLFGDWHRFDWNVGHFDNGGESGFEDFQAWVLGFTYGPTHSLTLSAELGDGRFVPPTGGLGSNWVNYYATLKWSITDDLDAGFRFDNAKIETRSGPVKETTSVRTVSLSHRIADHQRAIMDYAWTSEAPEADGTAVDDNLFRLTYRLSF